MKGLLLLGAFLMAPQSSTTTLWPSSTVPSIVDSTDTQSVELGVRFQSDVDGTITAIRFYKAAGNTGTHLGNLWTSTGANLAQVTFAGETASGWQQMNLASPVSITANTVYIVSYFCPGGHYSADQSYFTTGYDNAPLHAPADGAQGGNGLFVYGGSSAFPTQTYLASNYWVDVVFSPTPATPTPPPPGGGSTTASSAPRTGGSDHQSCGCGTASVPDGAGLSIGAALFLLLVSRRSACPFRRGRSHSSASS